MNIYRRAGTDGVVPVENEDVVGVRSCYGGGRSGREGGGREGVRKGGRIVSSERGLGGGIGAADGGGCGF